VRGRRAASPSSPPPSPSPSAPLKINQLNILPEKCANQSFNQLVNINFLLQQRPYKSISETVYQKNAAINHLIN
jgi:hypothetical protein